ncbi:DUF1835 domain-containing protein [Massilimicrobiota timonensis]|uniref:DUF1835 domain-containing protein n=1 Tax=Massilimicrobiota timonensis TaxID=1776392 RepID=A0A1Y4T235_9FIRM|nr:DUF1835 domain-containing protein [Massilimicrobiota timonensis]OUQ36215.1 hypothetical protein B5E75_01425 [Massilimicrobiota timonensis]
MLELCFDINTYHILKILQAENVIDSFHHIIYLYDDLSIGSLNVKNLEERITSLQALKVNYDFHKMIKNYKDMLSQIKNHHQIRIWTSSYAHEKIGFYITCYILYQFKFYDKQIYLCQSAKLHNNKYATMFLNVPDDFIDLMKKSEIINPSQYIKFAEKLIQENAPLRLKINNEIVSVQINYFDDMILSYKKQFPNISDQDLCGDILFDYHKQNFALMRDDIILNRIKYLKNKH